ncbi:MAG: hypothetical protein AABX40_09180 [Candidatus Hydrothermarchaeota archaeon]
MAKECVYIGQRAIYKGPFKAVIDDEGHTFPRGAAVEVCTETAKRLDKPPYRGHFIITDPTRKEGPCCEGKPC